MSLNLSGPIRDSKLIPGKGSDSAVQTSPINGIDGDPLYTTGIPTLNKTDFEWQSPAAYASGIRVGRDRMNEKKDLFGNDFKFGDGYGPVGATGCSAVDIYAGLGAHMTAAGKVPEVPVNPSAKFDAARVYISAKCDVDDMFKLPDGNIGNIKGKSAAVVKADHVRIHGREGVKIVTDARKNSIDRDIISVPAINLIAGDVGEDKMHPIPKGKNLLSALDDIVESINDLSTIVDNFLMFQHKYNVVIMSHNHPDPTGMSLGLLAAGSPTAFVGGTTLTSYDCATSGFEATVGALQCKKDLMLLNMRCQGVKKQRIAPFSGDFINSRQVFTS